MLTKKECEKALDRVARFCSWFSPYECPECIKLKDELDILDKLIDEHFDNPPLKFEELKEGMWIWDNNWNQYFEICEIYPKTKEFDVLIHQNRINKLRYEPMKFEPNRFYRKEVQE